METNEALRALAALSQDSRLRVFRALVQAGPAGLAAGRIADLTSIAPSSLSFHLKELAHAGLVESRQEGRFVIYTARFATMHALIGFLTENCCGGNPCDPLDAACAAPAAAHAEEICR
jgi:DNA-binding transcriptional ArsR family regulator